MTSSDLFPFSLELPFKCIPTKRKCRRDSPRRLPLPSWASFILALLVARRARECVPPRTSVAHPSSAVSHSPLAATSRPSFYFRARRDKGPKFVASLAGAAKSCFPLRLSSFFPPPLLSRGRVHSATLFPRGLGISDVDWGPLRCVLLFLPPLLLLFAISVFPLGGISGGTLLCKEKENPGGMRVLLMPERHTGEH